MSDQALIPAQPSPLALASQAADRAAAATAFGAYRARKAVRTRAAHDDDLARFATFLAEIGIAVDAGALTSEPAAWAEVSWGIVEAFVRWQVQAGYALASINRALSTVKVYAGLAFKAQAINDTGYQLIKAVKGYQGKEGRNLDAQRTQTRRGDKKPQPTALSRDQADRLKEQPDTPQGRRDALLLCLLLDHGLRVGEVAELPATAIDVRRGMLNFYRRKVDIDQVHKLTADTLRAAVAYLASDAPAGGPLLRGSRKNGQLAGQMSTRAIRERVRILGAAVGVERLSPHDLRHYWATTAARSGTHPFVLQEAGGWASLEMPRRYTARARIANEGVKLDG